MDSPLYSRGRTAFLVGVPLAWAVLLLFHPIDGDRFYDLVREDVTRWQIVHVGTLVFIALMGVVIYLLMRPLSGRAATVSCVAAAVFVVFYGAFEAVIGMGNGVLANYANGQSPAEQAAISDAMQSLSRDSFLFGDLGVIAGIGSAGWVVAVISAAIALHHAGAPRPVPWLMGLSAIATIHPPPTGPLGLLLFATAVALAARGARASAGLPAATPSPTPAVPRPAGS